mmetsp:Transcript_8105/g.19385  ORF Transcript_8105/g.19385 Transcript_8105/m.19385 type:complete len:239 (-) Transcript_8105:482-1198(-)
MLIDIHVWRWCHRESAGRILAVGIRVCVRPATERSNCFVKLMILLLWQMHLVSDLRVAQYLVAVQVDLHDVIWDHALLFGKRKHILIDSHKKWHRSLKDVEQPGWQDWNVHVLPTEREQKSAESLCSHREDMRLLPLEHNFLLSEKKSPEHDYVAHLERLKQQQEIASSHGVRKLICSGHTERHADVAQLDPSGGTESRARRVQKLRQRVLRQGSVARDAHAKQLSTAFHHGVEDSDA